MRLIIMLLLAVTLTACSATKQFVQSNDLESLHTTTAMQKSDSVAVKLTQNTIENATESTFNSVLSMTIKEYDTAKPNDSTTGRPPLKREIMTIKKQTKTEQAKLQQTNVKSDSVAKSLSDTLMTYKFTEQIHSESTKEKTRFAFPWFGVIGGLAFALLLILVLKRLRIFPY